MDKVLFLAMSGARENMLSQKAHSNNLANASTTGFKSDMAQARSMQVFGEGQPSRVYAMSERPATDREAGTLISTGRSLDVAARGNAWFAVQAVDGSESYTRMGEFQTTVDGQLVTRGGLPVLDIGGAPVIIPPAEKIDIGGDGTITIRPLGEGPEALAVIGQLKMVALDPQTSRKGLDGLMKVDGGEPLPADPAARLTSGYLESSNVNAVHELTSIISLARQFEMNIKMMKTAEDNSSAAAKILEV